MQHNDMTEESATYAAGRFTLGGAIAGRRSFEQAGVSAGTKIHYRAQTADGAQWEIGVGTYVTGGHIDRLSGITRPFGFGGAFSAPVTIAQVAPASSQLIVNGFAEARAEGINSAALAGGIAQAENTLAMLGAGATHEGAVVVGHFATSFAPYVDSFYGALRWSGTADTYSGQTTDQIRDYGGNVLLIEEYRVAVFDALVIAMRDSDQAVYAASIRGAIAYPGGGSLALVGTPTVTEIAKSAGVTVTASVSAANGGLTITANGNTDYWRWAATVTAAGV